MEASDMENSECQSAQAWIVQESADQTRPPIQTLGTAKVDRITYTVVHDLEDKTTFLHVSHVERKGSTKEKIFLALGFSQDKLFIPFGDVARKIEDYTSLETNPHDKIETDR
jgi:hypothetical protein